MVVAKKKAVKKKTAKKVTNKKPVKKVAAKKKVTAKKTSSKKRMAKILPAPKPVGSSVAVDTNGTVTVVANEIAAGSDFLELELDLEPVVEPNPKSGMARGSYRVAR